MRREGYEVQVSKPEMITKKIDGLLMEPVEMAMVDVPNEYSGAVIQIFGARKGFVEKYPDAVRAFLAAWFETIDYMRENRAQTIDVVRRTAHVSPAIATRGYDELMAMFNRTGRFDPKALDVLARSFVEMGSLPQAPDMRSLITEQFLPPIKVK